MSLKFKFVWITIFSIAMAHVEASLVVYLRDLYYPGNPLEIFPIAVLSDRDLAIEYSRELATIVMILSVAFLAESGFTRIFAAFVYVFGLWDLFYYLWLKTMIGWPLSWLDWDVLFLIPWPWLGPWITPAMIALLFVVWGGWILSSKTTHVFNRRTASLFILGCLLALAAFLLPVLALLSGGKQAFIGFVPEHFSWWIFIAGYLLMVVSLIFVAKDKE